ncbi:hypothetical protein J2S76_001794 [Ancylobacter vacuolatus]|uniref:Uncharacterized protein n=1 Tax=Ancylobacter vacuolatus TaxID=223389 RepID=A0ABU0DG18_9HYPH|nr:hypothetical protein [Ancylobacter vacuolatus]
MLKLVMRLWHWLTDAYEFHCPYCQSDELCEECLHFWAIK